MDIETHNFFPHFGNDLLVTRIKKIEFQNFRNIENGFVEAPNSEINDFLDGKPSIVGLYGQNGSGKSSVIMALGILKEILSGKSISEKYQSSIRYGCDRCTLTYYFTMYSHWINDEGVGVINGEELGGYEVIYRFDIAKKTEYPNYELRDTTPKKKEILKIENELLQYRILNPSKKDVPYSEVFSYLGMANPFRIHTFIDTREVSSRKKSFAFGSLKSERIYSANDKRRANQLKEFLQISNENSQSFVFYSKTIELLENVMFDPQKNDSKLIDFGKTFLNSFYDADSEELKEAITNELMSEFITDDLPETTETFKKVWNYYVINVPVMLVKFLQNFGRMYLHVIDTVKTGLTNINDQLPLLLWHKDGKKGVSFYDIPLDMNGPTEVPEKYFSEVSMSLNAISDVLEKIVPDLRLNFNDMGVSSNESNELCHNFEITSQRKNIVIPLKYESDGIRRIVSILSLLVAAYNDETVTIAIDEIESGIFEYMLGEILSIMADSAKGQFFFTSHNLRILEVIDSQYLLFTTVNPNNRFIAVKEIDNSENFRDEYYRYIILGGLQERLYSYTKKSSIKFAFLEARDEQYK